MSKYKVTFEVDEDKLRREHEDNIEDSIEWLVEEECGWINSVGIVFKNIERIKE